MPFAALDEEGYSSRFRHEVDERVMPSCPSVITAFSDRRIAFMEWRRQQAT